MGMKPRTPPSSPWLFAFLRAINVGGRTTTKDRLVAAFAEAGVRGAETFIASGNLAFPAPGADFDALERDLAGALRRECGYDVATFVRSLDQLRDLAAQRPFGAVDRTSGRDTLYVAFTAAPVDASRLDAHRTAVDRIDVYGAHIFWLRRLAHGESRMSGAVLERAIGAPCTLRNMNTVERLVARYGDR